MWFDHEQGWFWYKDPPEEMPEELEEPATPPEALAPAPREPEGPPLLSAQWIRENLEKFQIRAIDHPTQENLAAYMYIQKVMLDKSQRFAEQFKHVAGNSCKIAQAGVDYLAEKMDYGALSVAARQGPIASVAKGIGDKLDSFSSFLDELNTGSGMEELSEADITEMMGNVAWKVLNRMDLGGAGFVSFGGNELKEALMSMTGTLVGVKGPGDSPRIDPYPKILGVKAILEGNPDGAGEGPVKWTCGSSDTCTNLNRTAFTFSGLERLVNETLLGSDLAATTNASFVFKLLHNTGTLTNQDKSLISTAPYHMTRLRNMAVCAGPGNMGGVPAYATKAARLIAIEVIQTYMKDVVTSISKATHGLPADVYKDDEHYHMINVLVPKFQADLAKAQEEINREVEALQGDLPTTLETMYKSAVANCNLKPVRVINPVAGR